MLKTAHAPRVSENFTDHFLPPTNENYKLLL